jgi:uncharacterized protein (TIGR02996 family)/excisionase family DNA binding protein
MTATSETELLRAIEDRPDDDDLRRIYADWLDDQGRHERAEFIRAQLDLAKAPPCTHHGSRPDCPTCAIRRREGELLNSHGQAWLDAELPGLEMGLLRWVDWVPPRECGLRSRRATFRRGLVDAVSLSIADFMRDGPRLAQVFRHGSRVALWDRRPSRHRDGYGWSRAATGDLARDELPAELYAELGSGLGIWQTEDQALEALSKACLAYLRSGCDPRLGWRKVFTTGQVAILLRVAPQTVSKWFDAGKLRGYRIPGSQDRRIPREHLIRFMRDNGLLRHQQEAAQAALAATGTALPPVGEDEEQRLFEESVRNRSTFTTGQVARIIRVAPRTVIQWFDRGRLGGSRDRAGRRLVSQQELLRFLMENQMPVPGFLQEAAQVPQ